MAHAEPKNDSAAAQALFYEGRNMMKDGKFANACSKFEESLRLDYGIGTEFNLADCREKLGKLASAWSGFLNVVAAAKAANQPDRERIARDRAKALEPRVPKVVVDVSQPVPSGLEVRRDGLLVIPTAWGSPIPVDPGNHRVTASAPGKQPWESSVSALEGKVVHIAVPRELPSAGRAVAVAAPEPAAPAAEAAEAAPERAENGFPEPIVERRGGAQRTVGYAAAGLGLAGLAVGVGFGVNSLQNRDRSTSHCRGDVCDSTGVSLRDKAMRSGDIATVVGAAGGIALLGGAILALTAPSASTHTEARTPTIRAVPQVAVNGGGLSLSGVFQ
jgi:hypothetical protein